MKRLRFLQSVAPLTNGGREPRRGMRKGRAALLLAIALTGLVTFFLTRAAARVAPRPTVLPGVAAERRNHLSHPSDAGAEIWRVEQSGTSEAYSNGLRVDNSFAVSSHPRSYLAFPAGGAGGPARRSQPAGIVFHSTESQQAPFAAVHNEELKRIGESLLGFLRRRQCYHFLIDRFGRVYRVVAEGDAANHAGHSVWADDQWIYVNLNESFLGIAFEARTGRDRAEEEVTAAQKRSAVMLTEMLRNRYRIPAKNCVTHAQVSVNPSNMRIGYHVDWAAKFPYGDLGLPNNYATPLPAIWAFGFGWDPGFLQAAGGDMRGAVEAADEILNGRAAAAGLRAGAYRKRLQQQYREKLAALRAGGRDTSPPLTAP
ncbi:MAG: peptidoglycan recognition protein family protein [Acidobacteriia bacterium]|nr:peptidoglycan recognition protein family protein [Terriglobia bacterium]